MSLIHACRHAARTHGTAPTPAEQLAALAARTQALLDARSMLALLARHLDSEESLRAGQVVLREMAETSARQFARLAETTTTHAHLMKD